MWRCRYGLGSGCDAHADPAGCSLCSGVGLAPAQVALNELFHPDVAALLFCGAVDDHRNTDNAWMETAAVHVHDDTGDIFKHWAMTAGDDATGVRWIEYHVDMCLYSGHQHFLALAYQRLMKPYGIYFFNSRRRHFPRTVSPAIHPAALDPAPRPLSPARAA